MRQITDKIMMIRPASFGFNTETAVNNAFQTKARDSEAEEIKALAVVEFDNMVEILRAHNIRVIVIDDTETPIKPDAIFPNNWISIHDGGVVITYPMFAKNRRIERREDLVEKLLAKIGSARRYSFEYFEDEDMFLEGTGSMILDRVNKIVYACLSQRTDIRILDKFCVLMGYKQIAFHAVGDEGTPIYHTNVMMGLGKDFVVICMECIQEEKEQNILRNSFAESGKTIIEISFDQVKKFAGNMLQVRSIDEQAYLVMSESAYISLNEDQITQIEKISKIIHIPIPTIEKYGGGSVRCMMAEVFD